jgi:ABC-type nickel/cobalt efflux system permease component RcnA
MSAIADADTSSVGRTRMIETASRHARRAATLARMLVVSCVVGGLIMLGSPRASAHPIGNFTLNLYSGIVVSEGHVRIDYVLEMAELSTLDQKPGMDLDEDGTITPAEREGFAERASIQILTNLHMIASGQAVDLQLTDSTMRFRPGQGGLDLLYMQATFDGSLPSSGQVEYRDDNYDTRPGWREITVRADRGIAISDSTVPDRSVSEELKAYPTQLTLSPLNVREAAFGFQPSDAPVESTAPPTQGPVSTSPGGTSGFADLLATSSDRTVVLLLLLAFGFGFLHALGPGHGKTIMAASTLSGSVRIRHTVWLGGAVALMHCASVVALGLIALAATSFISSETVYSGLRVATAVSVLAVGGVLLVVRWRQRQRHQRSHANPHDHGHSHVPAKTRTDGMDRAGLAAVAVSGGLLPSPSAVVVLLGAVAIDRIPMGVALVVTFSLGLATALVVVGLMSSYAKTWLGRSEGRLVAWLPLASAAAIFTVGLVLTVQAVGTVF